MDGHRNEVLGLTAKPASSSRPIRGATTRPAAPSRTTARDVIAARAGYRTLRFTDRQLTEQPASVAAAVHALLADRHAA
jgi:hypothetical protein